MPKRKFVSAITLVCGKEELTAEVLDLIRVSKVIRSFYEDDVRDSSVLRMPIPEQFEPEVVLSFLDIVEERQLCGRVRLELIPDYLYVRVVILSDFLQVEPDFMAGLLSHPDALRFMQHDAKRLVSYPPDIWGMKLAQGLFESRNLPEERQEVLE